MFLKKIITYNLIILVLCAYNYKTVNYYLKLTNSSSAISQDYDCEEKDSESKKGDEKKEYPDYIHLEKNHSLLILPMLSFARHSNNLYSSSDYSLTVYSPPDTPLS